MAKADDSRLWICDDAECRDHAECLTYGGPANAWRGTACYCHNCSQQRNRLVVEALEKAPAPSISLYGDFE